MQKLGFGGFGLTWLCRDIILMKWRAIKILSARGSLEGVEEKIYDYLRITLR
ncbi:hypothetical protein F5X99DRAFT_381515 [Biscogniauxia marginata]|nr:hypothetical protein F5X99DRAFT_381515 [Biscogniauxia marginata]